MEQSKEGVRLDKWLWAARFFKTRSLSAEAIDAGKIRLNEERPKRAKEVHVGDLLVIRLGAFEHVLRVRALSERRGPAPEAAKLYEETDESRAAREKLAIQLKNMPTYLHPEGARPTKKDRRTIDRFKKRG